MTMQDPLDVRQSIVMRCVRDDVPGPALRVVLGYRISDPYAVAADFGAVGGEIVWTFGRELLSEGLDGAVGVGDVRAWPGVDRAGRDSLMIEFRSPDGELLVEASRSEVAIFLLRTYQLVPRGEEGAHLDVDAIISSLLTA